MTIAYTLSPKDLRDFIFHLFEKLCEPKSLRMTGGIFLAVLFLHSIIKEFSPSHLIEDGFAFSYLCFGIAMLYFFSKTHTFGQYLLVTSPGISCGKHELECRDGIIIERNASREIRRTWEQVSSVEKGQNHVGFIMKTPPCVWLPKNAFTSQEELAGFLQYARESSASTSAEITEAPRESFSMQQIHQGLLYLWKKQFWIIPVLLSLLGIAIYHYQEIKQEPSKTNSAFTEKQNGKGESYFTILPESTDVDDQGRSDYSVGIENPRSKGAEQ